MKAHPHFVSSPAATGSVLSLADLVGDLRRSVTHRLTREFRGDLPAPLLRRALDEAVESAWTTDFPHLFFPALAEERVRQVHAAIRPESASDRPLPQAA